MSEVTGLEKQLNDAKVYLENRESVLKLFRNPEFKKIILDGFCVRDCARYAQESQDPALTPAQQADALNLAQAAGHLKRYLNVQVQLGNHAESQIASLEEALVEVRNEMEGG
jgi:hypothetical protein